MAKVMPEKAGPVPIDDIDKLFPFHDFFLDAPQVNALFEIGARLIVE